jgi:hypothetical protein
LALQLLAECLQLLEDHHLLVSRHLLTSLGLWEVTQTTSSAVIGQENGAISQCSTTEGSGLAMIGTRRKDRSSLVLFDWLRPCRRVNRWRGVSTMNWQCTGNALTMHSGSRDVARGEGQWRSTDGPGDMPSRSGAPTG